VEFRNKKAVKRLRRNYEKIEEIIKNKALEKVLLKIEFGPVSEETQNWSRISIIS
jgi:hypothetical protein